MGRLDPASFRILNEDDPASAPTLPGHGSNNPNQENAVNRQQPNTAPADATSLLLRYRVAFEGLESLIAKAEGRADALCMLSELMGRQSHLGDSYWIVSKHELATLLFMIEDIQRAVTEINSVWLVHSEGLAKFQSALAGADEVGAR